MTIYSRAKPTEQQPDTGALPESAWFASLRRKAAAWYARAARDLPWRRTRDPYAIWISEVMLQQTQVITVLPYYARFLARFPTVQSLAAAREHDVLRLWEGLGYYRRGRMLHTAAQNIVAKHGGAFPRTFAEVRALPGIGRYTAGAICSFAYDAPTPILEANTVRVWARLLGYEESITAAAGQQRLWMAAERVLPRRGARQVNYALMELGAMVCTPRQPQCGICPVARLCAAHAAGLVHQIPRPKERPTVENVHEAALVIRSGARVLVRKRAAHERWAGLWDFIRFPLANSSPRAVPAALAAAARALGLRIRRPRALTTLKHGVTRFRITLDVYEAATTGGRLAHARDDIRWVSVAELPEYPLSTTGRKIARLLAEPARASKARTARA